MQLNTNWHQIGGATKHRIGYIGV